MFENLKSKLFSNRFSKGAAKNRLQMVLIQDRSGLSSSDMDNFQKDLIDVITRYFVLERNSLEIEWKRSDNTTALTINTPIASKSKKGAVKVAVGAQP